MSFNRRTARVALRRARPRLPARPKMLVLLAVSLLSLCSQLLLVRAPLARSSLPRRASISTLAPLVGCRPASFSRRTATVALLLAKKAPLAFLPRRSLLPPAKHRPPPSRQLTQRADPLRRARRARQMLDQPGTCRRPSSSRLPGRAHPLLRALPVRQTLVLRATCHRPSFSQPTVMAFLPPAPLLEMHRFRPLAKASPMLKVQAQRIA